MNPKETVIELRKVQERYKNIKASLGDVVISDMTKDAADTIESMQCFVDLVSSLPTCNDCAYKECKYRPKLGKTVRYNCFMHMHYNKGEKNEL